MDNQRGGPGASRRMSARVVQAVNEAFPVTLSPSPLIKVLQPLGPTKLAPNAVDRPNAKAVRLPPAIDTQSARTVATTLLQDIRDHQPKPKPVDHLKRLDTATLRLIAGFISDRLSALTSISLTCRRWYVATFGAVTQITLVPNETTIARLSAPGAMAALGSLLQPFKHGQHITHFRLVDSHHAAVSIGSTALGPRVHVGDLSRCISQLPRLTVLDVRGVISKGYVSWTDHFLADVAAHCPKLQVLRIGPVFLKTWENGWWTPLTGLKEFTVGSRREDVAWTVESVVNPTVPGGPDVTPPPPTAATGLTPLPDDFFVMLRTLPITQLKLWVPLASQTFTQLLTPTAAFPALQHLTVSLQGNHTLKLFEEPPKEDLAAAAAASGAGKKGADAKAAKSTKATEDPSAQKAAFPALTSVTIFEATSRPEFVAELMARLPTTAPLIQHVSITNSNRQVPRPVAPDTRPARPGARAAAAAAPPS